MLDDEQKVGERRKHERLFRKPRFHQIKSFNGFDFSHVAFPESYRRENLMGLGFIEKAKDFVLHNQAGRVRPI